MKRNCIVEFACNWDQAKREAKEAKQRAWTQNRGVASIRRIMAHWAGDLVGKCIGEWVFNRNRAVLAHAKAEMEEREAQHKRELQAHDYLDVDMWFTALP